MFPVKTSAFQRKPQTLHFIPYLRYLSPELCKKRNGIVLFIFLFNSILKLNFKLKTVSNYAKLAKNFRPSGKQASFSGENP